MIIQSFLNLINEKIYLFLGQNIIFFLLLFFIIITSFWLEKIWLKILQKNYFYFLIPGIIIHELSHLFSCYLTGAKVYKTKIISKSGGFVEHGKSKIPIIGNIIISFAPIVGGIAAIFLIYFLLNFPIITDFGPELLTLIQSWKFWIGFYLIASILITLIPSKQDLKNSFINLLLIFIFLMLLKITEINVLNLFNHHLLINLLFFVIIIQVSILLLSFPFYFLKLITTKLKNKS